MSNDKPQRGYIDSVQTLLSQARQSTKDAQAARRKQRREWLQTVWDEELPALQEYANDCIPDFYAAEGGTDSGTALENVRKKLLRCKATTREGFLSWAVKQIAKEPHFHLVSECLKRFDSYVSNFIDDAVMRHERYVNFPVYEKDGNLYRLNMGTIDAPVVWTVPEEYWGFVQRAFPVYLKKKPDGGYFIAKKVAGQTVPVHRLILAKRNLISPMSQTDRVRYCSGVIGIRTAREAAYARNRASRDR